ncbi:MAG: hypothetical protein IKR17_03020 [Bacteroidales bacterium]|nr:hypothetical protein [Bacteroidales bacterium]
METIDLQKPIWKKLISGEKEINLCYFPAKLLIAKWRTQVRVQGPNVDLNAGASELFNLYYEGQNMPNASRDIQNILAQ